MKLDMSAKTAFEYAGRVSGGAIGLAVSIPWRNSTSFN
jgi:hypothetical protein